MSSARALQSHKCGDTEVRVILYFVFREPGMRASQPKLFRTSFIRKLANEGRRRIMQVTDLGCWFGRASLDFRRGRISGGAQIFAPAPQACELCGGRNIGGSFLRRESRNACKVVNWGLIPDGFISAIFWQQSGGIVCSKTYHLEITGTFRRQDGGSMVNKCCLRYLGLASSRLKVLGGWIST